MRIIVTGAGGFIGNRLVHRLLEQEHQVVALDRMIDGTPKDAIALAGDLCNDAIRAAALTQGCDAIIHLATLPGGAAERDPAASRRINVDAMYDLLLDAGRAGNRPRFVFASSIAVFGDPLPAFVDDQTALSPKMIYGGHKAMMEQAVAMFSNRGLIDGVSLRLPGIVARPKGPSELKSAFMSNLFHALKAKQAFTSPVSAQGTMWLQSLDRTIENLVLALLLDPALLPPTHAVTLPALRVTMDALVREVARHCDAPLDLVTYAPDAALEAAFAAQPPLSTNAAERAGLAHDGTLERLVSSALASI